MPNEKIEVPLHVLEDLEVMRQGGKYNMMAGSDVWIEMYNRGDMGGTVVWLSKPKLDYYVLDYEKYVLALQELGKLRSIMDTVREGY